MALIKWGMMVVDGRGKLGGHVLTKSRNGATARTKVTPANPQTSYQQANRAIKVSLIQGKKASMKHLNEVEVIEEYCSYIRVDWKAMFAFFPWIKETFIDRLREFADLRPSTPRQIGLFSFT